MIHYAFLFNRQGKVRLSKWFSEATSKERKRITAEVVSAALARQPRQCNFIEWRDKKIIYKVRPLRAHAGALAVRRPHARVRRRARARSPVRARSGARAGAPGNGGVRARSCGSVRAGRAHGCARPASAVLTHARARGRVLFAMSAPAQRYASLYFVLVTDVHVNELISLEVIHLYVEALDRYFGNVCELDLIFNQHKAAYILDELLLGGHLQDNSKKSIAKAMMQQVRTRGQRSSRACVAPRTRHACVRARARARARWADRSRPCAPPNRTRWPSG